jgi:hypothetical protein
MKLKKIFDSPLQNLFILFWSLDHMLTSDLSMFRRLMLYHSLSLSFIALILSALSFATSATLSILLHLWCFPIYYIYLCNDLILLVNSLLLGGVVVLFLKSEKEDIRNIMGPVLVSPWLTIILTAVMWPSQL